ncbi:MAG: hypothetical protein ACJ8DZ_03100, partial [Allosphingosinicella sp.]
MASIPNTPAAPAPVNAGRPPAAAADPAAFARQFSETPEELLRIAAAILSGAGGESVASDGKADGSDDATTADPADSADAPSDTAQLAAFAPLLQSLPANVAVPLPAPEIMPAAVTTPAPAIPAAAAPPPATATTPAPAPAPKIETAAAATPA